MEEEEEEEKKEKEEETVVINTLRTGFLNCLNARSRGLTFRHRASLYIETGVSLLSRERFLYI